MILCIFFSAQSRLANRQTCVQETVVGDISSEKSVSCSHDEKNDDFLYVWEDWVVLLYEHHLQTTSLCGPR